MSEGLLLGVVRSYAVGPPRTAAVRLVGGLETVLGAVPVAAHVAAGDLTAGRECVVGFTEPNDYRSAVLVGVVGASVGGGGDVLPNYWNAQRASPEVTLPTSGLEARANSGSGAWGAWTTVQAATSQALVLLAAHFAEVTGASGSLWVQVGVDVTGGTTFTVRGEFGFHVFIAGAGASPIHTSTFRLAPYLVPAGSRVSVRGWSTAGIFAFQGYVAALPVTASWVDPWPNTYVAGGRATNLRRSPAVASWLTLPVSVAWQQAVASAPNDMLLTAGEIDPSSASGTQGLALEVGVGAVGSEVVFSRVGFPSCGLFTFPFGHQEFGRKALVLAGERVAVRKVLANGTQRLALYFEDL